MKNTTLVWESIEPGYEIPSTTKKPTYMQLFMFSAITWNRHLIHYNTEFAHHDGLDNVAVHRALLGNFLAQMLTDWIGDSGKLTKVEWNVRASAKPGDTLICLGAVTGKRIDEKNKLVDCDIRIENSEGILIAPGKGTVQLY